jgi:hypothetical protein
VKDWFFKVCLLKFATLYRYVEEQGAPTIQGKPTKGFLEGVSAAGEVTPAAAATEVGLVALFTRWHFSPSRLNNCSTWYEYSQLRAGS